MSNFKITNWRIAPKDLQLKGRYLAIDPCYVVPDKLWDAFCDEHTKLELVPGGSPMGHPYKDSDGEIKMKSDYLEDFRRTGKCCDINGRTCVIFSTAYGDGCYPIYKNGTLLGECGVDAGLLSFLDIDEETIKAVKRDEEDECDINSLGVFVELDGLFTMPSNGNAVVGDVSLLTDEDDKEENEEEEEEYEDNYENDEDEDDEDNDNSDRMRSADSIRSYVSDLFNSSKNEDKE